MDEGPSEVTCAKSVAFKGCMRQGGETITAWEELERTGVTLLYIASGLKVM